MFRRRRKNGLFIFIFIFIFARKLNRPYSWPRKEFQNEYGAHNDWKWMKQKTTTWENCSYIITHCPIPYPALTSDYQLWILYCCCAADRIPLLHLISFFIALGYFFSYFRHIWEYCMLGMFFIPTNYTLLPRKHNAQHTRNAATERANSNNRDSLWITTLWKINKITIIYCPGCWASRRAVRRKQAK